MIAVTGGIDLVSDAKRCFVIRNGRPEMGRITGTGCQLSGMMTAFLAANPENNLEAAAAAVCAMGLPVRLAGNICSREMETQPTVIGSSMRFIIWKEKNWKKVQNMRLDKKDMVLYAVNRPSLAEWRKPVQPGGKSAERWGYIYPAQGKKSG